MVEPPSPLEHALVARASAGDDAAFRMIFDRFAPAIRRFLGDLLRSDEAADEGTQETFVRAHRRMATLEDGQKLSSWLFGIARNVFYEQLRAKKHSGVGATEPPEEMDPGPSPEAALLGREAGRHLARALEGLSEERRAALLLRIDHGLDYGEITQVMGWTLAKVKNEIHRARLELRVQLNKSLGGVS